MAPDFKIIFASAFVPLIVGFIWYNPKVFGNAWMQLTGMTPEKGKEANMGLVFGLTFLFSLFMALQLNFMVIHQFGLSSMFEGNASAADPNSDLHKTLATLMSEFGGNFRSFKHGALHGTLATVFFVLPIIAINSLFEQRGWKYILINVGYFRVCLAIMGGIICQFSNISFK